MEEIGGVGGWGGRSVAPAAKAVHAFTPLRTFALSDSFEMTLKTLSLVLEGGGARQQQMLPLIWCRLRGVNAAFLHLLSGKTDA